MQEDLTEERRSTLKYLREEAMEDIIARGSITGGQTSRKPPYFFRHTVNRSRLFVKTATAISFAKSVTAICP